MDSRHVLGFLLLLPACKAEISNGQPDAATNRPDSSMVQNRDAGIDGQTSLGPWGTPAKVPGADGTLDEDDPTLSSTRLELIFKRADADSTNLYIMTRASTSSAWGNPVALTVLNSAVDEESPRLSADDLTLYFGRNGDIFKSTRTAVGAAWSTAVAVTSLNTAAYEKWAAVCSNGYTIVSRLVTNQGQDMFEGDITTGANKAITQFNSTGQDQGAFLTPDCLHVYFQSNRNNAQFDIYTASRVNMTAAWTNPTVIPDFNTATFNEEDPWVAADQRTFVFASNSGGNKDVYMSIR